MSIKNQLNVDIYNNGFIEKVNHYSNIARRMFAYLNGYINPFNACTLNIALYNNNNFAEYAKPDIVILYIGEILNFASNDMDIKKVMLITIAHELSHSNQNADMIRYTNNPYYKKQIEDANEGYTEIWLTNHADEIQRMFGIDMTKAFSDFSVKSIQPCASDYIQIDAKSYYINIIMDVIFRNAKMRNKIEGYFDNYQSIVFCINNGASALIKYMGDYNEKAIPVFNRIVNSFCRFGSVIGKFTIANNTRVGQIYDDANGLIMHFIVDNICFNPIMFK